MIGTVAFYTAVAVLTAWRTGWLDRIARTVRTVRK